MQVSNAKHKNAYKNHSMLITVHQFFLSFPSFNAVSETCFFHKILCMFSVIIHSFPFLLKLDIQFGSFHLENSKN